MNGGNPSSAVTGAEGEVRVVTGRAETLRITETPPVDYAVDGNSFGSEPPSTVVVSVGAQTSVTFVDSEGLPLPVRGHTATPPTVPSTPPPPPTTLPPEFVPKTTTTSTKIPIAPRSTTTTTFREDLPPSAKG